MQARDQKKNANFYLNKFPRELARAMGLNLDFVGSDPTQFAFEWGDTKISPALFAERVSAIASQIKGAMPPEMGEVLVNTLGLLLNTDNFMRLKRLPRNVRRKKERVARILLDGLSKDIGNINTVLSVLIYFGAIHGTAASVISPVGASAVAILAWGAVAFSTASLIRASLTAASPSLQFKDKLIQYKKMQKNIDSLEGDLAKLNQEKEEADSRFRKKHEEIERQIVAKMEIIKRFGNVNPLFKDGIERLLREDKQDEEAHAKIDVKIQGEIDAVKLEIQDWMKRQEQVKHQAIAIAQVDNMKAMEKGKKTRISEKLKERFSKRVQDVEENRVLKGSVIPTKALSSGEFKTLLRKPNPTLETQNLAIQMQKNHRDRVIKNSIKVFGFSLMAVGATLIAVSPAGGGYGTAPIAAVGLVLVGLGTAVVAGQYLTTKLVNGVATRYANSQERKDMIRENAAELPELEQIDSELSKWQRFKLAMTLTRKGTYIEEQRLKYLLSYEEQLKTSANPEMNKKIWFTKLKMKEGLSTSERNHLLDSAEKNALETRVLSEVLTRELPAKAKKRLANSVPNPDPQSAAATQELINQIPQETKQAILNRASRHSLRLGMGRGIKASFRYVGRNVKSGAGKVIELAKGAFARTPEMATDTAAAAAKMRANTVPGETMARHGHEDTAAEKAAEAEGLNHSGLWRAAVPGKPAQPLVHDDEKEGEGRGKKEEKSEEKSEESRGPHFG